MTLSTCNLSLKIPGLFKIQLVESLEIWYQSIKWVPSLDKHYTGRRVESQIKGRENAEAPLIDTRMYNPSQPLY